MSSLDAATIDRLVQAAQNCGMYGPRRDRLLAGIDPALRARLDEYKKPADQLRSDLETLAEVPPSDAGHPPLAIWLANARYMVDRGRVREAATFAEQWVATYMRWVLDVPPWSDDLAPAKAIPDTVSRTLFGRVVPVALVVFGLIGVVGIALADPASPQGAKAANFGYLACLSAVGLGVSVGLREFLGPNRVLVLIIVIFGALTVGYTFASAVTLMSAAPEPELDPETPGAAPPDTERERPGDDSLEASREPQSDAVHDIGDDSDIIEGPTDEADGIPGAGDARGETHNADRAGWLSTAAARREAPEGFETLPPGDFMMGSPPDEAGRRSNEGPQHPVTFTRPLWVQAHEVTQAEWRTLMDTSPSHFDGCDDCPVESVNWFEAVAYANARSEAEGLPLCYRLDGCTGDFGAGCGGETHCVGWDCAASDFVGLDCGGYRLPTEAEWEYVARAGTGFRYSSGDAEAVLAQTDWYDANSDYQTHPVGTMAANAWGLYDVQGNVSEWCHDGPRRYGATEAMTSPLGPPTGRDATVRGGSFLSSAYRARVASRNFKGSPIYRFRHVGFRLVRAP